MSSGEFSGTNNENHIFLVDIRSNNYEGLLKGEALQQNTVIGDAAHSLDTHYYNCWPVGLVLFAVQV